MPSLESEKYAYADDFGATAFVKKLEEPKSALKSKHGYIFRVNLDSEIKAQPHKNSDGGRPSSQPIGQTFAYSL